MIRPIPMALTDETLVRAVAELAVRDGDLAGIVERFGAPPLWAREPGFATLLRIILEQQVSLASAQAVYAKLTALADPLTPERFLSFDDGALRAMGFSRQKAGYGRHLAHALVAGELDLAALAEMSDADAFATLINLKGVGLWTATIYLLMALRRPDVWPAGDLALMAAVQEVKGLAAQPSLADMETIGEQWRPWRAVAARLLWHHYLSRRGS